MPSASRHETETPPESKAPRRHVPTHGAACAPPTSQRRETLAQPSWYSINVYNGWLAVVSCSYWQSNTNTRLYSLTEWMISVSRVRQSKISLIFLFFQSFPFCFQWVLVGRWKHSHSTRNEQRDQNRMTDRTAAAIRICFPPLKISTFLSLDVERLRISLSPTFVGRRGLIGAGNRFQVSRTILI